MAANKEQFLSDDLKQNSRICIQIVSESPCDFTMTTRHNQF